MPSDVTSRFETAIKEADEKSRSRFRQAHAVDPEIAKAFGPIAEAAGELEEHLRSTPGIELNISPGSVSVRLGDLELWLTYDAQSGKFVGEESAHSWYDSERYAEIYEWSTAEECTDALIRFCAQYYRMARAIDQAAPRR